MSAEIQSSVREAVSPTVLGRRLLSTFYNAFYLAQGNDASIQTPAYQVLGPYYHHEHGEEAISEALARVETQIDTLRPPKHHKPKEAEDIAQQFADHWKDFKANLKPNLQESAFEYDPTEPKCETVITNIVSSLVKRDNDYMQTHRYKSHGELLPFAGRPVGASGRDPRQSFVRDYVLEGQDIGDGVLNMLLADAKEILVGSRSVGRGAQDIMDPIYSEHMPKLVRAWEAHHPGQQFLDRSEYQGLPIFRAISA